MYVCSRLPLARDLLLLFAWIVMRRFCPDAGPAAVEAKRCGRDAALRRSGGAAVCNRTPTVRGLGAAQPPRHPPGSMSMSSHDAWPLKEAAAWTPPPEKLHWRDVAAGEPERTLHPTSDHLGPELPDWTENPKAIEWNPPLFLADGDRIEQVGGTLSSQVRAHKHRARPNQDHRSACCRLRWTYA